MIPRHQVINKTGIKIIPAYKGGVMKNKILVVEDSLSVRKFLKDFLTGYGYEVETAENGKEALEKLRADFSQLVITDLEMPVMDGAELIDNISLMEEQPVIIVLTSHDDTDLIVDIMKKGVFDYLIKPVKNSDILLRIQNAFKISELNHIKKISEKEKLIRLEQQLDWYKFTDRMLMKDGKGKESNLFENLRRSLNQGSGIGVIVSLVDFITKSSKKKDGVYEIDENIINEILKNQDLVYKTMQVLEDIEKIISSDPVLKTISMNSLYNMIEKSIMEMQKSAAVAGHSLVLSGRKSIFDHVKLIINQDRIRQVIDELFINAMKYSEKKSDIIAILDYKDGNIIFSVINNILPGDDGIPMEYENIVFEPFFRKIKYIHEEYKTLDYGLGLTLVDRIIRKHNGKVTLYNITDFSNISKNPVKKVCCEVTLPGSKTN